MGADMTAAKPQLDLAAEIKDDEGTIVQILRDHIEIKQSDSPAVWNAGVVLLPGTYSIKILARDGGTGRMGTFLGKFTIQNLSRDPQVPISSVVLSSRFADDAPSTVRAVIPVLALDPLIHDGKRMIPSVTRVFSAKDDMYVYLQAFEQGAKTAAPLMARVTFYKGSAKILETPQVTVTEGLDPKSFMLPIRMNVGSRVFADSSRGLPHIAEVPSSSYGETASPEITHTFAPGEHRNSLTTRLGGCRAQRDGIPPKLPGRIAKGRKYVNFRSGTYLS
jgi:hypothetical protein